jgi:hypothetical protein
MKYMLRILLFTLTSAPTVWLLLIFLMEPIDIETFVHNILNGPAYFILLSFLPIVPGFIFLYAWLEYLSRRKMSYLQRKSSFAIAGAPLLILFSCMPLIVSPIEEILFAELGICYASMFCLAVCIFSMPAKMRLAQ